MSQLIEFEKLAQVEIAQLAPPNWRFQWNWRAREFGLCKYASKTIEISMDVAAKNTLDRFKLTLYHEIAHSLTEGHKHDDVWKAKSLELGGNGEQCFQWKLWEHSENEQAVVPGKGWELVCPAHGIRALRFKLATVDKTRFFKCGKSTCNESIQWRRVR